MAGPVSIVMVKPRRLPATPTPPFSPPSPAMSVLLPAVAPSKTPLWVLVHLLHMDKGAKPHWATR